MCKKIANDNDTWHLFIAAVAYHFSLVKAKERAGASKPRGEWRKLRHGYFRGGGEKILWPSILYCEFCNVCFTDISSACMGHESEFVSCIEVFTLSLQFYNVIELQIKSNLFFHCKPFKHTFLGRLPLTCQTWLGPEFKGQVTKNEDEFQKTDRGNFRYCPLI